MVNVAHQLGVIVGFATKRYDDKKSV